MRRQPVEFGECIQCQPLDAHKVGAHNLRYVPGVWLGIRPQTSEVSVGTDKGVFKARSIRRMSDDSKWSAEAISNIKGTPWKPCDFDDSDKIRVRMPEPADDINHDEWKGRGSDQEPRKMAIMKRDLEKYGYTPHCPGCYAAMHSKANRAHTFECRSKIMKLSAC